MSENRGDNLWMVGLVLFFGGLAMAVAGSLRFERFFSLGHMPAISWLLIGLGYPCALAWLIVIVMSVVRSEKR